MLSHIFRIFYILYACVAVYFFNRNFALFTLHPSLTTAAFIILMSEGIQLFYPQNIISRTLPKKNKIKLHWIVQTAAGLAVGLGFILIFTLKITAGKNHFTTWHGTLGAVTCVCVACAALGGISNLYRSKLPSFMKTYRLRAIHKCFGVATFLLGLITIGFGFLSTWAESELSALQRYVFILLLLPLGISLLYRAIKT